MARCKGMGMLATAVRLEEDKEDDMMMVLVMCVCDERVRYQVFSGACPGAQLRHHLLLDVLIVLL